MSKFTFLLFVLLCVNGLFSRISAQSNRPELTGTWIIDSVQVRTVINGRPSMFVYKTGDEVKTYIPSPSEVVFSTENVTFNYNGRTAETAPYQRSSNGLKVMWPVAILNYGLTFLNENTIRIDYLIDYVIDGKDDARDEYKYFGHRK